MMRARLAGFAHTLRGAGFAIGHAEVQDAARLLTTPLAERPELLRAALRALFCSRHSDLERFDEMFDAFWRGSGAKTRDAGHRAGSCGALAAQVRGGTGRRRSAIGASRKRPSAASTDGAAAEGRGRKGGASAQESASAKDLRKLDNEKERAEALRLAERLARADARAPDPPRARPLARPAARSSLDDPPQRRPRRRADRSEVSPAQSRSRCASSSLLDASGSMEPYTAFFTRFLHAVSLSFRESEAFLFHTRLAHVSSALRERDPVARARPLRANGAGRRRRHADRRVSRRVQSLARAPGHSLPHLRDDPL